MRELIRERLAALERREHVKVLYACESGSRAWGFPSSDSDYDVRFIYVRPTEDYLTLTEPRDVLEEPLEGMLDINGWDVKKALQLLRKSNPPLLEWLDSPIVYLEDGPTAARMRELAQTYFSPRSCAYHYLSMARNTFRAYLQGESVRLKKYFYALRPLLAINWIESGRGPVPTLFVQLVEHGIVGAELRGLIYELLELKRSGAELDVGPPIPQLHNFIEHELARLEQGLLVPRNDTPPDMLSALFRITLRETWGVEVIA